jgi:hypothetical protein
VQYVYWVEYAELKSCYQLRDVSFGFAVMVKIRFRLRKFPHCCFCSLRMHQPLPTISAVLGQETVECETAKI